MAELCSEIFVNVLIIVHNILFQEPEVLFVLCVKANIWYGERLAPGAIVKYMSRMF